MRGNRLPRVVEEEGVLWKEGEHVRHVGDERVVTVRLLTKENDEDHVEPKHQEVQGIDTEDATDVKVAQREPPRGVLFSETQRGDEEPTKHEKQRDAGRTVKHGPDVVVRRVGGHDKQNCDGAQAVEDGKTPCREEVLVGENAVTHAAPRLNAPVASQRQMLSTEIACTEARLCRLAAPPPEGGTASGAYSERGHRSLVV